MINAAIVGLGWWGKTLVEALADGSDVMRFSAVTTRTVSPDVEAFAKQHKLRLLDSYEAMLADPKIDAVVLATPPSGHVQADDRRGGCRQARVLRKAVHATPRRKPRPRSRPCARRSVTLGVGYNRRFHPEMIKLRERIRSGGLGIIQHIEAT